jgi:phosphate-selective porin OprO and OprP
MCAWIHCIAPLLVALSGVARADEPAAEAHDWFRHGDKGFEFGDKDGNWFANVDLRAQLRYTGTDIDERSLAGGSERHEDEAELNRLRLKIGGNVLRPWIAYYYEQELTDPQRLLDLRLTFEFEDWLQVRVGQWKIPFNRERVDSSGSQQFVDRSIANAYFTLDRQRGAAVSGRVLAGSPADSSYSFGLYEPLGRDGTGSYQDPLLLARWQWNLLGRVLDFSQSDIGYREQAAASLAAAAATYRGPYTAFSSSGGGQLDGFPAGTSDQYEVRQWLLETALQHRGASWQQEWHHKRVRDTVAGTTTRLSGGYAQAGVFPHTLLPRFPSPLEFALRYAWVDPDDSIADDRKTEATLVANWFFRGHRNKLTMDYGWLTDGMTQPGESRQRRLRLQWDVSL